MSFLAATFNVVSNELSNKLAQKSQMRVCRLMPLIVRHSNESELLDAESIRGWRHNDKGLRRRRFVSPRRSE